MSNYNPDPDKVKREAQGRVKQQRFNEAVAKEVERLKLYRPTFWSRLFPWRIRIERIK